MGTSRRKFIKNVGMAGAGISLFSGTSCKSVAATPSRKTNSVYMGDFKAPKLDTVKCAFIGVGARGSGHVTRIASLPGTEVVAISDLYEDLAEKSVNNARIIGKGERHQEVKAYFGEPELWRKMLMETKPDAVFISTNWKNHSPMAVEAMKAGAHAFVEVPLAITNDELWEIVDTSETTQRHCMMLENVNYGREELLYLNMCRQGVIGELLHGEAAYIHELRSQMKQVERGTGSWRTYHYAERNGNLYPTHGLGPVAQYMNLGRGDDNFKFINSFSSPAKGRAIYAKENFPADHKWNQLNFKGGDINTSVIKTELGRTIMVQWDETSPRPYSRHNLIQGTDGTLAGFPTRVALEGEAYNHHEWIQGEKLAEIYEKYEHPLYKRMGEEATKAGGHGGMDFIMMARVIECLRNGEALDQNMYEGCFWTAVSFLSEFSVAQNGAPQEFPDYTRGNWKNTLPLEIIT